MKVFLNCFHFNGTRIPKGIKRSTFSTTYAFAFGPPSVSKNFRLIPVRAPGSRSNMVIIKSIIK
ncbi:hypothetical protein F180042I2_07000 [Enterocloster bolteae]